MKKFLAYGLSAAMVMSSVSVFAEEVQPGAVKVNYGVNVVAEGQEVKEDITILTDGDAASASLYMKVDAEGDTVEIDLPNYVLQTGEDAYVNAGSVIATVEQLAGVGGLAETASAFGITEDWIKLAPIDVNALSMNIKPYEGAMPEFDEETIGELTNIAMSLMKMDFTDDGMSYIINDETIKATAGALDEFKAKRLSFVGDMLTYAQDVVTEAANTDLKPAVRNYLDAVAAGYAEANDASEEDAVSMIDMLFDMAVSGGMSEAAEQLKAVPVADMWNSFSFAQLAEKLNGFEAKVSIGEEIAFDITYGEQSVKGTVEMTDDGAVITFLQGEEVMATATIVVDAASTDNASTSCTVVDGEGNLMIETKSTVQIDGNNVDVTYSLEDPAEDVLMDGYFSVTEWENDGSLTAPETSDDVLEVIKNVSAMLFAPSELEE